VAFSDITLTTGVRGVLFSLQETGIHMERVQARLSSGKKVNSAIDDPIVYFAAQSHLNRASDLGKLKDGIQESIYTVAAANNGLTSIADLLVSAKAIAQTALATADQAARNLYEAQFDEILSQIDTLAGDSSYKNKNLLKGDSLLVNFAETSGQSTLNVAGVDATSTGLGVSSATGNWTSDTNIQTSLNQLTSATATERAYSRLLSDSSGILTVRRDFNDRMVNILNTGADNLTLADMNEEGANMLMLSTRQNLQFTSMTMAMQAAQEVLNLF